MSTPATSASPNSSQSAESGARLRRAAVWVLLVGGVVTLLDSFLEASWFVLRDGGVPFSVRFDELADLAAVRSTSPIAVHIQLLCWLCFSVAVLGAVVAVAAERRPGRASAVVCLLGSVGGIAVTAVETRPVGGRGDVVDWIGFAGRGWYLALFGFALVAAAAVVSLAGHRRSASELA